MQTTERRRARNDDDKQERRAAIVEAAWQLFREGSYDGVTMAEVAARLGLVKGTVYLYFRTKEELFLDIEADQLGLWFDGLDARLSRVRSLTPARAARLLAESLDGRDDLLRLNAILSTVLERNVDDEVIAGFKRTVLARMAASGQRLGDLLPFLGKDGGIRLLLRLHALVVGLHHAACPSARVAAVLQQEDLRVFDIDFRAELQATLHAILAGLETMERGAKS